MERSRTSLRRGAGIAAVAVVAALLAPTVAVALQQQVVGGHALDANLRTDGSGFNTATSGNRVSGLQSNVYRAYGSSSRATRGLSSASYRPGRATSGGVDTRYGGGSAYAIETGSGTFTRGTGRADPLRNPQYSVLQTGAMVQRGRIPGATPMRAPISAPRSSATAFRMTGGNRAPTSGLTSTQYAVARRGR